MNECLYSILGLQSNCTTEEIRAAYLRKVKVVHPDRFHPTEEPVKWEEANRIMQRLNLAYETLSNQDTRRKYDADRLDFQRVNQPSDSAFYKEFESPVKRTLGSLSDVAQNRLLRLLQESSAAHFVISTRGQGNRVVLLVILSLFFPMLFWMGGWSADFMYHFMGAALLVGLAIGHLIAVILDARRSPLKEKLLITPFYILVSSKHSIVAWSLNELEKLSALNSYFKGVYAGTTIRFKFRNRSKHITVYDEKAYECITETMRRNRAALVTAIREGNLTYFKNLSRFEVFEQRSTTAHHALPLAKFSERIRHFRPKMRIAVFVGSFLLFVGAYFHDLSFVVQPPQNLISKAYTVKTKYSFPAQPIPETGSRMISERTAQNPLEIETSGDDHHYVKLVDTYDGRTVAIAFIKSGQKISIKVPVGTYEIKYATGQIWYGETQLFGPGTSYGKADKAFMFTSERGHVNGFKVSLVARRNGNLRTLAISENDF